MTSEDRATAHRRITCVSNSLIAGGAERAMIWLTSALAAQGHDVTLLTLFPPASDHYEVGAAVSRVSCPPPVSQPCPWNDIGCVGRRLRSLRQSILATRPDLVISFIDTVNVQVLLALLGTGVPTVVSERIYPPLHAIGRRWNFLRRLVYPTARAVVMQTRIAGDWARQRWPRWQVREIPNAVPPPDDATSSAPGWFGPRNVVAMGRLVGQKNFALLVEAFAKATVARPEWHLGIVGEGPEHEALAALGRSLGIAERLHLPGTLRAPWRSLRTADIFAVSSDYEGFPNVLLEAMANGLPTVSTDCPAGPAEIIQDGSDGLLVPPRDVAAFAQALEALMADDVYRLSLGARASAVQRRFSDAAVAASWQGLVEDVLDGSGHRK